MPNPADVSQYSSDKLKNIIELLYLKMYTTKLKL